MATAQKLEINIEAKTTGKSEVESLISTLAKAGVDVAPFREEASKLDAELKQLAQQQALIDSFKSQKVATEATKEAMDAAQQKAQQLGRELSAIESPTKAQKANFEAARAAVKETSAEYQASVIKLQDLRQVLANTGISTKDLAAAQTALKQKLSENAGELGNLQAKVQTAAKAQGEFADKTQKTSGIADELSEKLKGLALGFVGMNLVNAMADMERMQAGLTAVSGSSEAAAKDMEFLRGVAVRSGLDIQEAAKAYLSLSASTKGTQVEGEATRQVFEAVSRSMSIAGKSSAETSLALQALGQMAGKGQVQMEELRGQLGEALPGALNAAAKGMGIATKDLIQLVETGRITAQDIFPALTKGLNEMYGTAPKAQTLSAEITNIKNAFTELAAHLGESGGLGALKVGAEVAQAAIVVLDAGIIALGQKIGVMAAAITSWDFSGITQQFTDIEAAAQEKFLKAAEHNDVLKNAIKATGTEAINAKLQHQEHAEKVAAEGDAAKETGTTYIALASAYEKVKKELAENITLAEKKLDAAKAEATILEQQAKIYGNQAEQMQASAKAAELVADASAKVAEAKNIELGVLKVELNAKKEFLEAEGKISEERKKELKELQDVIDKKQAEADKSNAQAEASKMLSQQVALETEKHKDNSARLGELANEYRKATAEAEKLRAQKARGIDVTNQLSEAETRAAKALALYRDAQSDLVEKYKVRQTAEKINADVAVITLNAQKASLTAIMEEQKAQGNTAAALQTQIQIKRVDLALIQARANAMRIEADNNIEVAKAQLAVLESSGKLDPVKRAEIKGSIAIAEAKKIEANAVEMGTAAVMREINTLQAAAFGVDSYADATNRAATAQNNLADAASKASSAVSRGGATGKDGPFASDTPKFSSQAEADEWLKQSTAKISASDPYGYIQQKWLQLAYQKGVKEMQDAKGGGAAPVSTAPAPSPSPSTPAAPTSTVNNVYTVNIPKAGIAVNVASQSDAERLMAAFKDGKLTSGM